MDTYKNKDWLKKPRYCDEYRIAVSQFVDYACEIASLRGTLKCPCKRCGNRLFLKPEEVKTHLICDGMDKNYAKSIWVFHGEEQLIASESEGDEATGSDELDHQNIDMHGMLCDALGMSNMVNETNSGSYECFGAEGEGLGLDEEAENFYRLLEKANQELYPGCKNFNKLSFIIRLYHTKCLNRWIDKSIDDLLTLLNEVLPEGANLPKKFHQMKKIIDDLGLGYNKIHACPNDCLLFWKEYGNDSTCKKCGASRYKEENRKIPAKVLRHFPLIPRLKRLYMSSKTAVSMRWHDEGRKKDGVLRYPADSMAWHSLDKQYSNFASDARNIRLGLASDGFNPFGTMSLSYSIWPVMLTVYNLPPWMCIKDSYMIMSLLIPGPKAPGNDIDIYLEPLIDELKELWEIGVDTYDSYANEIFKLHVALLWTINDFSAYGNLSGWKTKGRFACPHCNEDTSCLFLRNSRKCCYMGHRRFLDENHYFHRNKSSFDGKVEHRQAPKLRSGSDILNQMQGFDFEFGKSQPKEREKGKKRKQCKNYYTGWKKKSIFFSLPYWDKLLLRHNLDVMHIEKNICDSVIGTLLNIEGKTKDSLKARFDLVDLSLRPHLHPKNSGEIPAACYTMSKKEKQVFCKVLSTIKFPDGYASNLSRRVDVASCKIHGLKSHDCHIIMQKLLPLALRKTLPKEVSTVLIELSNFFETLCSKVATVEDFERLEYQISVILCHLGKVFLPAFFDIMVHLAIHLAYEAAIAGPVHYRWMYPIER